VTHLQRDAAFFATEQSKYVRSTSLAHRTVETSTKHWMLEAEDGRETKKEASSQQCCGRPNFSVQNLSFSNNILECLQISKSCKPSRIHIAFNTKHTPKRYLPSTLLLARKSGIPHMGGGLKCKRRIRFLKSLFETVPQEERETSHCQHLLRKRAVLQNHGKLSLVTMVSIQTHTEINQK
jgi:hypothetical protein